MTQPTLVVWLPEKFGLTVPGSLYGTAHFVFQVACFYGFGLPEKTAWSFGLSGICGSCVYCVGASLSGSL